MFIRCPEFISIFAFLELCKIGRFQHFIRLHISCSRLRLYIGSITEEMPSIVDLWLNKEVASIRPRVFKSRSEVFFVLKRSYNNVIVASVTRDAIDVSLSIFIVDICDVSQIPSVPSSRWNTPAQLNEHDPSGQFITNGSDLRDFLIPFLRNARSYYLGRLISEQ